MTIKDTKAALSVLGWTFGGDEYDGLGPDATAWATRGSSYHSKTVSGSYDDSKREVVMAARAALVQEIKGYWKP